MIFRKYYMLVLCSLATLSAGAQNLVNSNGAMVHTRFIPPTGYERISSAAHSFASFLRELPLLPNGASIKFYTDTIKPRRTSRPAAVVDMEIDTKNLQQIPQSVMRLWGEFLYEQQHYSAIHFHIRREEPIPYDEWSQGMKIIVDRQAHWTKTPNDPRQYRTFRRYLDFIFTYSDFQTLLQDVEQIPSENLAPGDLLLLQTSGIQQALIILDMAVNEKTNEKIVLLAGGGNPTQSIRVLQNTAKGKWGPWFPIRKNGEITVGDISFSPATDFYRFRK